MVDALKNIMSTMTDTITRQVSEYVKRAMEAANSARPLTHFNYIPTYGGKPSHRPERIPSAQYTKWEGGAPRLDRSSWPYTEQPARRATARPSGRPTQGAMAKSMTASTPYATHSRGHPMLRRPPPMTAPHKLQNAPKYCEFHEQSGHTMIKCRELKKALHELADKGQIDRFLKRGPQFLRRKQEPAQPQPRDEECSTEVLAIIARGYAEGITRSA
ncbi:hypothetical protein Cgig2_002732 [Carnegiea gigantea]|uniref:Reverse transcriptase domain-containing protein n=1 Tax=Carnegiea gigantea TaxID=171969 RepID=A0A9Q1GWM6_9CARY|nr:hypothetical protein Cgig2_002732 [Carnegiea gigantea]